MIIHVTEIYKHALGMIISNFNLAYGDISVNYINQLFFIYLLARRQNNNFEP